MEEIENGHFEVEDSGCFEDIVLSPENVSVKIAVTAPSPKKPTQNGHSENGFSSPDKQNGVHSNEETASEIKNGLNGKQTESDGKEETSGDDEVTTNGDAAADTEESKEIEEENTEKDEKKEVDVEIEEEGSEEEEAAEEGEEEEDVPLSKLCSKESVTEVSKIESPPKEQPIEEKQRLPVSPSPLHQIRGRPGLRSGSPHLNASFQVRSEPSSPSGVLFPRLRKADAQMSLIQNTPGRKRSRTTEAMPDCPSSKRSCQNWLSRWWNGPAGEEPTPSSATEALAEHAPSSSSTSTIPCSIM